MKTNRDLSLRRYLDPRNCSTDEYIKIAEKLKQRKTLKDFTVGERDRYNFQALNNSFLGVQKAPKSEWGLIPLRRKIMLIADISKLTKPNTSNSNDFDEKNNVEKKWTNHQERQVPLNYSVEKNVEIEEIRNIPRHKALLSKNNPFLQTENNFSSMIRNIEKQHSHFHTRHNLVSNNIFRQIFTIMTGKVLGNANVNNVKGSSNSGMNESIFVKMKEKIIPFSRSNGDLLLNKSPKNNESDQIKKKQEPQNNIRGYPKDVLKKIREEKLRYTTKPTSNMRGIAGNFTGEGKKGSFFAQTVDEEEGTSMEKSLIQIHLPPRIKALQNYFEERKFMKNSRRMKKLDRLISKKEWKKEDYRWAERTLKFWSCDNAINRRPAEKYSSRVEKSETNDEPNIADQTISEQEKQIQTATAISESEKPIRTAKVTSELDKLIRTSTAYLPYASVSNQIKEKPTYLKHRDYKSERHGSIVDPIVVKDKISPEAQEILLTLRDTVSLIIDDIVKLETEISNRNFQQCITISDHLNMIPDMIIALIDHLHYTPQEFEIVSVAKNITSIIEDVANEPIVILFRMIELGHYLYYLGRVLGENIIPKDLAHLLHSIQVKLQRIKVGRVVRQYFHIPINYDFAITPYNKDRQLIKLEDECRCLINLLHPDDPRSKYCPTGYRTIEVLYDENEGKFETFAHRLNRILVPNRCTVRLVSTILRQFNGQEVAMTAEHAIDLLNSDHRPRYQDILELVVAGSKEKQKQ